MNLDNDSFSTLCIKPQAICHTSFPRYPPPRPLFQRRPALRKVQRKRKKVKEQFTGRKRAKGCGIKSKPGKQHLSKEWKMGLRL